VNHDLEKLKILKTLAESEQIAGVAIVSDDEAVGFCIGGSNIYNSGKLINSLRGIADHIQSHLEANIGETKTAELLQDVADNTKQVVKADHVKTVRK
jgi:hypothetical protein